MTANNNYSFPFKIRVSSFSMLFLIFSTFHICSECLIPMVQQNPDIDTNNSSSSESDIISSSSSNSSNTTESHEVPPDSINSNLMEIQEDQPQNKETSSVVRKHQLPEMCDMSFLNGENLSCMHVRNIDFVLEKMTDGITTLEILTGNLSHLNLSVFHKFKTLRNISITHSNVIHLEGRLPGNVHLLNLSWNHLDPNTVGNPFREVKNGESEFNIEILDLSNNWVRNVTELPKSIFTVASMKKLLLKGNRLEGQFVWSKMWEWIWEKGDRRTLVPDADDTFCVFVYHTEGRTLPVPLTSSPGAVSPQREVPVPSLTSSVLGCLLAKTQFEDVCETVDKHACSSCTSLGLQRDLEKRSRYKNYPLSYNGKHGSLAISLEVDCSRRGLTRLPKLPIQTWRLDVPDNEISDLSPLKELEYLVYLDASNNSVNVDTLITSRFLKDFTILSLKSNKIYLSKGFFDAVEGSSTNKGEIFLADNYLHCDCMTVVETRKKIIERCPDWREIYCGNMQTSNGSHLSLKDLNFDPCINPPDTSDLDKQTWIYLIIVVEAILIILIVGKVWYDQRRFRRTGKLPWFSQRMPRLPCDAMLEGIKDRRVSIPQNPHGGNNGGAHQSSQFSVHRSNSNASRSLLNNPPCSSSLRMMPTEEHEMKSSRSNSNSDSTNSHNSPGGGGGEDAESSRNLLFSY